MKCQENDDAPVSGLVPVDNREPRVRVHGLRAGVRSGHRTRTRVTRDGHTTGGLAKPVECPTARAGSCTVVTQTKTVGEVEAAV